MIQTNLQKQYSHFCKHFSALRYWYGLCYGVARGCLTLVEISTNYYTVDGMDDCIFCKIINGKMDASVELETDSVIAFKSIDPASDVHILIAPKKHIKSFENIVSEDKDLLSEMVEVAQSLIKKNNTSGGYKLIFNGGKFQSISHLHWHLLGGKLKENYYEKT